MICAKITIHLCVWRGVGMLWYCLFCSVVVTWPNIDMYPSFTFSDNRFFTDLWGPKGGVLIQRMYRTVRTAPWNSYPHWHRVCKSLPLLAQNQGPDPYPCWHKVTKKGTLCGTTIVEKWLIGTIVGAIFDIPHSPWHKHWKNHTLSGTCP